MIPNIPEPILNLLYEIGEVAGKNAYLVGGFVRDLLLKRPSSDIDIVVEGDAIRVAETMSERWNGTLETHSQFGTATVTPENIDLPKVDFVTARRETYQGTGTLPIVQRGTITDDLHRRDFSINALAMRLDTNAFGTIVDKTGGLEDLEAGIVRVLHKQSFIDDPTRIFRAARYAGRYNFRIDETDQVLIQEALPILPQLSGERIRNEIDRVLLEKHAAKIVEHLTQLGVWQVIFVGQNISTAFVYDFKKAEQTISWASAHLVDETFQPERVRWMTLLGTDMPICQIEAISFRLGLAHQLQRLISRTQAMKRGVSLEEVTASNFEKLGFSLSKNTSIEHQNGMWCIVDADNMNTYVCGEGNLYRVQTPLTAYRQLKQTLTALKATVKPSEVYQLLKSYPIEALVLGYVDAIVPEWKREKIKDYLLVLRKVQPFITGDDLIALGEKPGKAFETVLWESFAAQLDGKTATKSEAFCRLRDSKTTRPAKHCKLKK
ncbi:MAG: CCA tRNA nucleotidyltransferase [Candidatus Poribacteria bacterium]|nr:CCA tRNA nucleotidyltransferase [Candidatus Poribacteria bacterium]